MLVPVHFTVAGQFKINNATSQPAIVQGTLLTLGAVGDESYVEAVNNTADYVVGVAGDNFRFDQAATKHLGYAADIVINSAGDTTRSMNRINDLYKDTLGSGLMTVYSGVGTFRTTVYDTTVVTWTLSEPLYTNAAGEITNVPSASAQVVGRLVGKPQKFPNGVPGVDVQNSMSLGTFLTFTLNV